MPQIPSGLITLSILSPLSILSIHGQPSFRGCVRLALQKELKWIALASCTGTVGTPIFLLPWAMKPIAESKGYETAQLRNRQAHGSTIFLGMKSSMGLRRQNPCILPFRQRRPSAPGLRGAQRRGRRPLGAGAGAGRAWRLKELFCDLQ